MNPRLPAARELEQLFQDLEDGALSADDHARLMGLLRHHREVRHAYLEHMAVSTGLHDLAAAWIPDHEEPAPETWEVRERRILRRSFMAAAALVTLAAIIGSFIAIRNHLRPPASAVAGNSTVWKFQNGGIGGSGEFLPATQVVVTHGTLELTNRNQTRMLLEGPAVFEIHNPLQTSISSGKGWFEVSPKDKRFTVHTEHLRVIDLGTRFGIAASAANDRVQVESGRVRIESRFPGIATMELKSGQAAGADLVGRCTAAPYDPALFLHHLPRQAVAIHWTFDQEIDGGFPSSAYGFSPESVRVVGFGSGPAKPRIVPGRFGSALDLSAGDTFAESDFPGIAGSGPRTVALWLKTKPIKRRAMVGAVDYTPPVLIWGDAVKPGSIWSFRVHCTSGIIGTQWGGNGWITAGKIGSRNIHDGQWHHFASVFTGQVDDSGKIEIRHYIDGQRVTTTQAILDVGIDTRTGTNPSGKLRLAYDADFAAGPANVPVVIDELLIIRAALDDAGIDTIFRDNRIPNAR